MTTNETNETGLTVVAIPTDKAQAVIDFVGTLETEETDVTGHMLSRGMIGGISGGAFSAKKTRTDTGCVQTTTGVGVDFTCSDSDTLS